MARVNKVSLSSLVLEDQINETLASEQAATKEPTSYDKILP